MIRGIWGVILLLPVIIYAGEKQYRANWSIDLPVIAVAGSISLGTKVIGLKPEYNLEHYRVEDLNWLDRQGVNYYSPALSTISDITFGGLVLSVAGLNLIDQSGEGYLHEITIITETVLLNNLLNTIAKYAFNRPRPYIYSRKASKAQMEDSDATHSFYSGHTSNAFALAVSFATIFSDRFNKGWQRGLIWGGSLLTAGTIGYLRVRAGKHFYSDVITGAVVGSAFGYLIPYLHRSNQQVGVTPIEGRGMMISFGGTF